MLLGLSDAVSVGIIGLAGVTVTAVSAVIAAMVTRGQSSKVSKAADDFEARWLERGEILDTVLVREERCLERLGAAEAEARIAEARIAEAETRIAALEHRSRSRG